MDQRQRKRLTELTYAVMEAYRIPGLSVAVARDDEILYARGFGYSNKEEEVTATPATVYGIGSVTKSFTALAVLMLARQGKISLGAPVQHYLPEFKAPTQEATRSMTVHHFLTHTSGLPPTGALRYSMVKSLAGDPSVAELKKTGQWQEWLAHPPLADYNDLLSFLARGEYKLLARCGEQFSYSNDAYALLGTIVERVSGVSYTTFVADRILQPLGMDNSAFMLDDLPATAGVTQLYFKTKAGDVIAAPRWNAAPAMVGAGFLKSTVLDLVKYGQVYLKGKPHLLPDTDLALMTGTYFPCGRGKYYGYGLMVHPDYHGTRLVEHGGSLKGIAAAFGCLPELGVTAAVLTNLAEVPASKIWLGALNLSLGLPIETPLCAEPAYKATKEEMARWVGVYAGDEGVRVSITLADGKPFYECKGEKQPLRPSGPDSAAFSYRGEAAEVKFLPGFDGRARAVFHGLRILRREED